MKKYIISLDQGTTSSRAVVFDRAQNIVGMAQEDFGQIFPAPGWVEHDPEEIFRTQERVFHKVVAQTGIAPAEIAAVGIANQRETTVVWDKITGKPIYNAIVWQCRRTAPICERLMADGLAETIRDTTGLVVDAYFSGTKLAWILDNVPGARERARQGDLLFGTVDTWLIWKLTGGRTHATDYTNASRTMLLDIGALAWDEAICRALDIPLRMLPDIKRSGDFYGHIRLDGLEIPIAGVAGDQQAALYGQACFTQGEAKNTYGTGCFLLMNTAGQRVKSRNGLLTTLAAADSEKPQYVLEGSVFVGGAVIQWLRDEMRFLGEARDAQYFAQKAPDNGGVYFVPAFTGLGAPYWDMYARGGIFGLTRGTTREHIIRAAQESIAYQSADLLRAMTADSGLALSSLKVDGGASRDDFLMQFQADIMDTPVKRPAVLESTALGVCYLAGLTTGFFTDKAAIQKDRGPDVTYTPRMEAPERSRLLRGWEKAVSRSCGWEERG